MFKWAPASGQVGGIIQSITTDDVINSPTNPTSKFEKIFRLRYLNLDPTTGCGLLYACMGNGHLFEFGYSPTTDTMDYRTYWKSDYEATIQDAHPYFLNGQWRILAAKDTETFALVVPSTQTCP